jgi:hypothetical protein
MNFVASLSVPLHCAVTFCAPALALLSEASVGLLGEPGVVCRDYSKFSRELHRFIPFTIRIVEGSHTHKEQGPDRCLNNRSISDPGPVWAPKPFSTSSDWGLNRKKPNLARSMRLDLMTTGSSVRVANKLSEERLRQARNGNHNVTGDRYSCRDLFFFEENSWQSCFGESRERIR